MRFSLYLKLMIALFAWFNMLPIAAYGTSPESGKSPHIREQVAMGRTWLLKDWPEGNRPYLYDLKEREDRYRQVWGEDWFGPVSGRRIHSPGNWRWEVFDTVPSELASKLKRVYKRGKTKSWGHSRVNCYIWAPGGEGVTDVYTITMTGIYTYDVIKEKRLFIGNSLERGFRDGKDKEALLSPGPGGIATLDQVTGRLFFVQERKRHQKVLRYLEKLTPFKCLATEKIYYLPAFLNWNNLYQEVKSPAGGPLKPAMQDETQNDAIFVVRTNTAFDNILLPGTIRGSRPLISPDGKSIYLATEGSHSLDWDTHTLYDRLGRYDLETGQLIEKIALTGNPPRNHQQDGPGTHGGNCVGYDGLIYTCQHGGSGGGAGRMFSIAPNTGELTMLYDSMKDDGSWRKNKTKELIDGPADARNLNFTSTLWQVQSPRTGAIINGGWDNSGIRRYHDGFVTTVANGDEGWRLPPRPDWIGAPTFYHNNSNPSIAPNGDLFIADANSEIPRIIRIYRTDWPKEQPVNGYAEKFISKEHLQTLMLEYAEQYISNYDRNSQLLKSN